MKKVTLKKPSDKKDVFESGPHLVHKNKKVKRSDC